MQESPKLAVAAENDVTTAAAVSAIGSGHSTEFGAKEVPASCTAMSAFTEHAYIVDEVIFFQNRFRYATVDKDTWSISQISKVMRKIFLLFSSSWLMFFTCSKENELKGLPLCVKNQIDSLLAQPQWNPPAEVWKYNYNGQTVYFVPQHCCDLPSLLIDENCNIICHPDGGISGGGDGKCVDFMEKKKDGVLIWKDTR
jgi:hypothetical protein